MLDGQAAAAPTPTPQAPAQGEPTPTAGAPTQEPTPASPPQDGSTATPPQQPDLQDGEMAKYYRIQSKKRGEEARKLRQRLREAEEKLNTLATNPGGATPSKTDAAIQAANAERDAAIRERNLIERAAPIATAMRLRLSGFLDYLNAEGVDATDATAMRAAATAYKDEFDMEMRALGYVPATAQPTPPAPTAGEGEGVATPAPQPRAPSPMDTTGTPAAASEEAQHTSSLNNAWEAIETAKDKYGPGSRQYRDAHRAYNDARSEARNTEAGKRALAKWKASMH